MRQHIENLDQEIASLLDGKLDATRRSRLLKHLAADPEAYQVYAIALDLMDSGELAAGEAERSAEDPVERGEVAPSEGSGSLSEDRRVVAFPTVHEGPRGASAATGKASSPSDDPATPESAVADADASTTGSADPVPPGGGPKTLGRAAPSMRGLGRLKRPLAAVFALFAVGLAFLLVERGVLRPGVEGSRALSAVLQTNRALTERLDENWSRPVAFRGATRGGVDDVETSRTSFALGAELLRLDLALGLDQRDAARRIALEIARRLQSTALLGSAPAYEELAAFLAADGPATDDGVPPIDRSREAERRLIGMVQEYLDADALAFGRWVEAGRIASAAGDRSTFRSRAFRKAGADLGDGLSPADRDDLAEVRRLLEGELAGPELAELQALFTRLVRRHER